MDEKYEEKRQNNRRSYSVFLFVVLCCVVCDPNESMNKKDSLGLGGSWDSFVVRPVLSSTAANVTFMTATKHRNEPV